MNRNSGPRYIDIDVSNACGHNCVFCGLYNQEAVQKLKSEAKQDPSLLDIYKHKISKDDFDWILKNIPSTVERVTLGGAGEPFTHPDILYFIQALQDKKINVAIYTHFTLLNKEMIDQLSLLGEKGNPDALEFIVNISGASAETYIKTRPNQKAETYKALLENLRYACDIFNREQKGLGITLMTVMNSLNYHEMPQYVALTKSIGAQRLWVKPMEVHGESIKKYLISPEQEFDYALKCKLTLHLAKILGVKLHQSYVLNLITEKKREELKQQDFQFKLLFKEELLRLSELNLYQFVNLEKQSEDLESKGLKNEYQVDQQQSIQNAAHPLKYFDQNPCSISQEYIRFKTDGSISPCCIYPKDFILSEERKNLNFQEIWNHPKYQMFSHETLNFPQNLGHRKNPEFSFCHQCPHLDIHEDIKTK